MYLRGYTDYDSVMCFTERVRKAGLTITDGGNTRIYKNPQFQLGLSERDRALEEYNRFNRVLTKAGIPIVYMTWEPNQVLSTRYAVGEHMRGAKGRIVDMDELESRPYTHGRVYGEEEHIKIALHPNDPPTESLVGIHNLIHSAERLLAIWWMIFRNLSERERC